VVTLSARARDVAVMRVTIVKFAPWTREALLFSAHPEYTAFRNIIFGNPQHNYALVGHGPRYEHFRVGKVALYNLGCRNKLAYIFAFFMDFWLILLTKPKVVVAMAGINLIPIAIASKIVRAKLVAVIISDIWYFLSLIPLAGRGFFKLLLRGSLNGASVVLAISESIKRELVEDYHVDERKALVFRFTVSSIFNPTVPRTLKRKLNPAGPIVLTVCRIDPQKGLEYLVKASPAVIRRVENVRFVIRSYSSDKKYERYLTDLIRELGVEEHFKIIREFSTYDKIPAYMVAADVFALPSVSEGLGLVILEAMASGIPVVASRVGGVPDIIRDGINGLLVEARDVNALSEALVLLLSDTGMRKRLAAAGLTAASKARENELERLLTRFMFAT
jgi:glycosyltransferase involved in cell wall biosynthesis